VIVEDVRIKTKNGTSGNQHDEGFFSYYDVQVFVFNHWWSLEKDPEKCTDLDKALALRDTILDGIKGRRQ